MITSLKEIPHHPGVYKFFSNEKIIYIGKAKNLKKRVSSYFRGSIHDRKTTQIRELTDRIETFATRNEAEALLLEQSLIKENLPKFNILLRDDKTYPYIYYSSKHKFPSVSLRRTKHATDENFFGPFISTHAVKEIIKDMQKIFNIRNCSDSTFRNRARPCIEYQMKRCSAPCVNFISQDQYSIDILSSKEYLTSSRKKILLTLRDQMKKYAENLNFEQANEAKKQISTLESMQQDQSVITGLLDVDIFYIYEEFGKTGCCILSTREGRIRGTKEHVFNQTFLPDRNAIFQTLILNFYRNAFTLPKKIYLSSSNIDVALISQSLQIRFNKKIDFTVRSRGPLKSLVSLAKLNARQAILNKIQLTDKYAFAFQELGKLIGIPATKLSVEGYDVSHLSGSHASASCVRFDHLGPQKKLYRLFNIPNSIAGDDISSLTHALQRRIAREEQNPLPDIILIDGGINQLNAAINVFQHRNNKSMKILSIFKGAKRIRATDTILSDEGIIEVAKNSKAFLLLQEIRDEAHRFAIKNSRNKKRKSIKFSELDAVDGIGPAKRERLLSVFKTTSSLKKATLNQLCSIPGINPRLAQRIIEQLSKL